MALAFDTLKYAKTLEKAGVKPPIAEAHANALRAIINDNLATKADIALVNQNIENLRKETATSIEQLRQEAKTDRALIRNEIQELGLKLKLWLGGCIVTAVLVLTAIIKL